MNEYCKGTVRIRTAARARAPVCMPHRLAAPRARTVNDVYSQYTSNSHEGPGGRGVCSGRVWAGPPSVVVGYAPVKNTVHDHIRIPEIQTTPGGRAA